MRVVLQRVAEARVVIEDRVAGQIGAGVLLLAAFRDQDDSATIDWMAQRILGLRVFPDEDGKMNRSVEEVGGEVLVVSQFTLYGDTRKGRRPSFVDAARPEIAIPLYEEFVATLRKGPCSVRTGEFGAAMRVELVNDGPVTIILDR